MPHVPPSAVLRRSFVLAMVALFALSSTAGGGASRSGSDSEEVVIGAALDLSAGWTSLGRASRVTLDLAVRDANAALARTGSATRVQLRVVDTKGTPAGSLRAVRNLASQGVTIVIGPQTSSGVAEVRLRLRRPGMTIISQGSTAHSLAIAGDNVFRFVPDDVREGEAMVALLRRDGVDAVVPVWRRDAGNAGLARSVRMQFRPHGRVAKGVGYSESVTNFTPVVSAVAAQVAQLKAAGAKRVAVYLAGFDEVVDLFRVARREATLSATRWYGSDGVALTTRLIHDRSAAAFAHAVGYPNPTVGLSDSVLRRARPLIRRARARLGREPDALALGAYDALRIAVDASERAGETSGSVFRRSLVAVANNHDGATGRMVLNSAGDRAYGSYDFWSVCPAGGAAFGWERLLTYVANRVGQGRVVSHGRC